MGLRPTDLLDTEGQRTNKFGEGKNMALLQQNSVVETTKSEPGNPQQTLTTAITVTVPSLVLLVGTINLLAAPTSGGGGFWLAGCLQVAGDLDVPSPNLTGSQPGSGLLLSYPQLVVSRVLELSAGTHLLSVAAEVRDLASRLLTLTALDQLWLQLTVLSNAR